MSDPLRIAYYHRPHHPAFLESMAQAKGCALVEVPEGTEAEAGRAMLAECEGYYVKATRDELPQPYHVTGDLLERMPNLLLVASYGAGYDTVDVDACTRAGVAVCNQSGGNAEAVAEHALAFILTLLKRIPEASEAIAAGTAADRSRLLGTELYGRTVGLVGIGHIGTRMAEILALFRCRVLACDPAHDTEAVAARGAEKVDLPTLMAESDIVSIHCPLSAQTRGMIGAAELGLMRPGGLLISTARGGIHDEDAVLAALEDGHLAGAGLDVWATEPPATDYALARHPRVIATSHTAGVTHESRTRLGTMAAQAFQDLAAGRAPYNFLNPEVGGRFMARLADRLS